MEKILKLLLFYIFLLSSSFLYTQELRIPDGSGSYKNNIIEESYKKEWNTLNNSDDFSTNGWIELEVKYIEIWDLELNSLYQRLMEKLSSSKRSHLLASQRAWLESYDKKQKFLSILLIQEKLNGSSGHALFYTKLLNEKKERVYELVEYCHMLEVDPSFIFHAE